MQSSQHSWFCIWWLGWFPWKRFCRSPVDFTRDLCKAVLVSLTPGAVNQGLSTSPMTWEMLFWDVPSSSYPSCQLSLGFERSLFRAGQSPFSPIRHNVHLCKPTWRWGLLWSPVAQRRPQDSQAGLPTGVLYWSLPHVLPYFQLYSLGKYQSPPQQCQGQDREKMHQALLVESLISEISS